MNIISVMFSWSCSSIDKPSALTDTIEEETGTESTLNECLEELQIQQDGVSLSSFEPVFFLQQYQLKY